MKKIILVIFILVFFILALCYQSILIDRNVSKVPFTPNIFVSPSSVKKTMNLEDYHSGAYVARLNDSINNCRFISSTPSGNDKVIGAVWKIKYDNMNPENLVKYLEKQGLSLFDPLNNKNDLFSKKRKIFRNYHISQYLEGRYDKIEDSYTIVYEYPNSYISFSNRNSLTKSLKDFFIGTPH